MKYEEIKEKVKEIGAEVSEKVSKGAEHLKIEVQKLIGPRWDTDKDDVYGRISQLEEKINEQQVEIERHRIVAVVLGLLVIGSFVAFLVIR